MKQRAIVYCEGAFNTPNGKTAHGLVRFSKRYQIKSVVDASYAGKDAGEVLDGVANQIPIYPSLSQALKFSKKEVSHLVIGLAPDGGRLNKSAIKDVKLAIQSGLHIGSGLHDFLSENKELAKLAGEYKVQIHDIRKPPPRDSLHFFCGKIEKVKALKIAILGTDSAIGKRTTAWLLVQALEKLGTSVQMIGTGQTAWMQGAKYSLIMDSLINDFVSGEIEHAVYTAWKEARPEVIVIEGQGSLMNPAYPGGFEILAGARPDMIVLQDAPAREEYDGFPGYPIHPLAKQIEVIELLSNKPVIAITINHEKLSLEQIPIVCDTIASITGIPAFDVLKDGAEDLAKLILAFKRSRSCK